MAVVMTLVPSAAKTASKEAVNLMSRDADEELARVRLVGEFHRDVAGLLGDPAGDRVRSNAGDPHEAAVVVYERKDACGGERCRHGRSRTVRPFAWATRNSAQVGPDLRGDRSVRGAQDRPDARGGDDDAHGVQFAVDRW